MANPETIKKATANGTLCPKCGKVSKKIVAKIAQFGVNAGGRMFCACGNKVIAAPISVAAPASAAATKKAAKAK